MPLIPPPDPHILYRLEKVENQAEELEIEKKKLSDSILMLGVKIENGLFQLSDKIKEFENRRQFWNKILIGILTAGALALITQLLRISYVVQSNRISGGE